jgi:hypothetical protein
MTDIIAEYDPGQVIPFEILKIHLLCNESHRKKNRNSSTLIKTPGYESVKLFAGNPNDGICI